MRFSEIKKKRPDSGPRQPPKTPDPGLPSEEPVPPPGKKAAMFRAPGNPARPVAPKPPSESSPPKPACGRTTGAAAPASSLQVQAAHECYGALVASVKDLARHWGDDLPGQSTRLRRSLSACLEELSSQPSPLLCLTTRSTASNYIYAHSANTSILAMYLALGLGWPSQALRLLGLAAMLHEFQLAEMLKLPLETGSPAAEEAREQRLHPAERGALGQHLLDLEAAIRHTAEQGIPDVKLASHILGVCDLYESLSHFRAWREPMIPHDAIRHLIKEHAAGFDRKAKELLLQRLTLYPPGSFVQLTQGQTACVTSVDHRTPTLPTVSIRLDASGSPLAPPEEVELASNSLVHITMPVDETKLGLKDKKVLMALQAERWWVT